MPPLAFRLVEDLRLAEDRVPGGLDAGKELDLTQRPNLPYHTLLAAQSSSDTILLP